MVLTGCRTDQASPGGPRPAPSEAPPASTTSASPPSRPAPASPARVVVLDPGHNGGNARDPKAINRLVPAGRGQTKPCNTTGTATNAGYGEHAFNWDVAQRVGADLSAKGISVVYTRADDTGVGPCVDERAATGNRTEAAAVVSIHADGSNSAGAHGFHVAYSAPPLNAAQGQPSTSLASTLRDRLRAAGFDVSNYLGRDGLAPRNDLAGLNLSERPAALIECGNMRDPAEAALMSTSDGRQRYADAIADGILAYLS
ncbi:N-acetylmuramoyl-L-alanine amidase [Amycolatopsis taiwanensis]|uniref:N-acetylmuramoyl-L-alanine amidase n=1 Tax=Amycolatopsis taiwanensis TaxID=342230 RepID=UPI000A03FAFA|nr:N-acetylmuramoyl-L-alanine amidase [Amycolatopsis taiwanensis]